ncbi:hypothetical protein MTO96_000388 [Rhipicephalus appendiculatus]
MMERTGKRGSAPQAAKKTTRLDQRPDHSIAAQAAGCQDLGRRTFCGRRRVAKTNYQGAVRGRIAKVALATSTPTIVACNAARRREKELFSRSARKPPTPRRVARGLSFWR